MRRLPEFLGTQFIRLSTLGGDVYIDETGKLRVTGGTGLENVLMLFRGSGTVRTFAANEAGLNEANQAAGSGDILVIPACTIALTAPFQVSGAYTLAGLGGGKSAIHGTVVLADGCTLINLQVQDYHTSGQPGDAIALQASTTGWAEVHNCDIYAYAQSGYTAAGIYLPSNASQWVEFFHCSVQGECEVGGEGYAGWRAFGGTGRADFYGCRLYGTTDWFRED